MIWRIISLLNFIINVGNLFSGEGEWNDENFFEESHTNLPQNLPATPVFDQAHDDPLPSVPDIEKLPSNTEPLGTLNVDSLPDYLLDNSLKDLGQPSTLDNLPLLTSFVKNFLGEDDAPEC